MPAPPRPILRRPSIGSRSSRLSIAISAVEAGQISAQLGDDNRSVHIEEIEEIKRNVSVEERKVSTSVGDYYRASHGRGKRKGTRKWQEVET